MPRYDSYELTQKESIRYYIISGLVLAGIGYLFYHNIFFCILLMSLTYPAKKYYIKHLSEKRKRELTGQFRDLLYSLSASFATGRHMKEALEDASEGLLLIYNEDSPICTELSYMVKKMKETKQSEEELLRDFAIRSCLDDIQSFVDIYSICKKSGGNLEKVVMKAAEVLLDKIDIQREIHKLTAQKRLESYIITAIPFVIIGFLHIASPDYLSIMYETLAGKMIMSFALLGIFISYIWSTKLTQIEL